MTAYSSSSNGELLIQLSNDVGRIAGTFARLSAEVGPGVFAHSGGSASGPEVSADAVMAVIRARRLRAHYFTEEIFADPAWDILLDLLHAELMHQRVAVSSVCAAAAVPPTTALRWLSTLVDKGLVRREADPHDRRRVFVELSSEASAALRRYFQEVRGAATI